MLCGALTGLWARIAQLSNWYCKQTGGREVLFATVRLAFGHTGTNPSEEIYKFLPVLSVYLSTIWGMHEHVLDACSGTGLTSANLRITRRSRGSSLPVYIATAPSGVLNGIDWDCRWETCGDIEASAWEEWLPAEMWWCHIWEIPELEETVEECLQERVTATQVYSLSAVTTTSSSHVRLRVQNCAVTHYRLFRYK